MVAISRPLAVVLALLGCGLADAIPRAAAAPAQKPDFFAAMRRQPMIFFVVKGAPNACGLGCSEWIAADGVIDQDAGKRLHDFVAGLPRRDLPIFFHSTGGSAVQAMAMGVVMREHRMTAAVGRTFPEGCRNGVDDACRRLLQSKS